MHWEGREEQGGNEGRKLGVFTVKISQNKMLHTDYSASVQGGQHTLIYVWRVNRAIEIRGGSERETKE